MGWATGSSLMEDVIYGIKIEIDDFDTRVKVYKVLITSFEEYDCDTLQECIGLDDAFDDAYASFGYDIDNDIDNDDDPF